MKGATSGDRMWGLRELPLPDPVSWGPETYGWAIVAGCLLGILVWLGAKRYARWREQAYRRDALAELTTMERDREQLAQLPLVLRRTALFAFPREDVAALRGRQWIDWLNAAGAEFALPDAEPLDRLAYQPGFAQQLEAETVDRLLSASAAFLRKHRAGV